MGGLCFVGDMFFLEEDLLRGGVADDGGGVVG